MSTEPQHPKRPTFTLQINSLSAIKHLFDEGTEAGLEFRRAAAAAFVSRELSGYVSNEQIRAEGKRLSDQLNAQVEQLLSVPAGYGKRRLSADGAKMMREKIQESTKEIIRASVDEFFAKGEPAIIQQAVEARIKQLAERAVTEALIAQRVAIEQMLAPLVEAGVQARLAEIAAQIAAK